MTLAAIDDQGTVERAMSETTGGVKRISLGLIESAIYLALVQENQKTGAPIPARRAREITLKHTHSRNAGVVLNRLESKGALQAGSDRSQNRFRIPLVRDVEIFTGRGSSLRRVWPPESEGAASVDESGPPIEEQAPRPISPRTPPIPPALPATAERFSEALYILPPATPPVILRGKRVFVYEKLISLAHSLERLLTLTDIKPIVRSCGIFYPASFINCFDLNLGLFVRERGVLGSNTDPCLRALVVRPYARGEGGEVHVPRLCEQHASARTRTPSPASPPAAVGSRLKSKTKLEEELAAVQGELHEVGEQVQRMREQREDILLTLQERVDAIRQTFEEAEAALHHAKEEEDPTRTLVQRAHELDQKMQRLQKALEVYDLFMEEVQEHSS